MWNVHRCALYLLSQLFSEVYTFTVSAHFTHPSTRHPFSPSTARATSETQNTTTRNTILSETLTFTEQRAPPSRDTPYTTSSLSRDGVSDSDDGNRANHLYHDREGVQVALDAASHPPPQHERQ